MTSTGAASDRASVVTSLRNDIVLYTLPLPDCLHRAAGDGDGVRNTAGRTQAYGGGRRGLELRDGRDVAPVSCRTSGSGTAGGLRLFRKLLCADPCGRAVRLVFLGRPGVSAQTHGGSDRDTRFGLHISGGPAGRVGAGELAARSGDRA